MLSVSDFEGCHTAVAEGGVMRCLPLMTDWGGAAEVYRPDLVQPDVAGLVNYFERNYPQFEDAATALQQEFVETFSAERVFSDWNKVLFSNLEVETDAQRQAMASETL